VHDESTVLRALPAGVSTLLTKLVVTPALLILIIGREFYAQIRGRRMSAVDYAQLSQSARSRRMSDVYVEVALLRALRDGTPKALAEIYDALGPIRLLARPRTLEVKQKIVESALWEQQAVMYARMRPTLSDKSRLPEAYLNFLDTVAAWRFERHELPLNLTELFGGDSIAFPQIYHSIDGILREARGDDSGALEAYARALGCMRLHDEGAAEIRARLEWLSQNRRD